MIRRPGSSACAMLLAAGLLLVGCSRQETAWRDASQADSETAYAAYLDAHPAGAHASEARQRLAELREQQEWQRALRLDTPESYQRYLAAHPHGRFGDAARARLAEFLGDRTTDGVVAPATAALPERAVEPESAAAAPATGTLLAEAAGTGWRVQLGAFGEGEQAARDAWRDLRAGHPELLGQLVPRVDVVSRDGRSLWRLQAGPVSEPRAREICAGLATRGARCIVVSD